MPRRAKVLVVDADPQGTATYWRSLQAERAGSFQIVAQPSAVLHNELPALARNSTYDYLIVDCPPGGNVKGQGTGQITRSALLVSDLLLIPIVPSGPDYWAAQDMLLLIEMAQQVNPKLKTAVVVNRKMPNTELVNKPVRRLSCFSSLCSRRKSHNGSVS